MTVPPPEGFVLVTRRSPFLDLVGPLWVRQATDGERRILRASAVFAVQSGG